MKTFYRAKETKNPAKDFGELFNSFDERCGDFLEWFIEERQEDRAALLSGFNGNEENEWDALYDAFEKKYRGKFFECVSADKSRYWPPHCSLRLLDADEVEEDL